MEKSNTGLFDEFEHLFADFATRSVNLSNIKVEQYNCCVDETICHVIEPFLNYVLGPKQGTLLVEGEKSYCGKDIKDEILTFYCEDCATDETCILCSNCFAHSGHKDHKVITKFASSSGFCDCGDITAWKEYPTCSVHEIIENEKYSPEDIFLLRSYLDVLFKFSAQAISLIFESDLVDYEEELEYFLVLFNDEYHTFDQVIKALNESMGYDYEVCKYCANVVDRFGFCMVGKGNLCDIQEKAKKFDNCFVDSIILKARILTSTQVSILFLLDAIFKHVSTVSNLGASLARITCFAFFNVEKTEQNSLIIPAHSSGAYFVSRIRYLWKDVRKHLIKGFFRNFLPEKICKEIFCTVIGRNFKEVHNDIVYDAYWSTNSIQNLYVHIFTSPPIAHMLLQDYQVLQTLLDPKNVNEMVKTADRSHCDRMRLLEVNSSIRYLLSTLPDKWSPEFSKCITQSFVNCLELYMKHSVNITIFNIREQIYIKNIASKSDGMRFVLNAMKNIFRWIVFDVDTCFKCMNILKGYIELMDFTLNDDIEIDFTQRPISKFLKQVYKKKENLLIHYILPQYYTRLYVEANVTYSGNQSGRMLLTHDQLKRFSMGAVYNLSTYEHADLKLILGRSRQLDTLCHYIYSGGNLIYYDIPALQMTIYFSEDVDSLLSCMISKFFFFIEIFDEFCKNRKIKYMLEIATVFYATLYSCFAFRYHKGMTDDSFEKVDIVKKCLMSYIGFSDIPQKQLKILYKHICGVIDLDYSDSRFDELIHQICTWKSSSDYGNAVFSIKEELLVEFNPIFNFILFKTAGINYNRDSCNGFNHQYTAGVEYLPKLREDVKIKMIEFLTSDILHYAIWQHFDSFLKSESSDCYLIFVLLHLLQLMAYEGVKLGNSHLQSLVMRFFKDPPCQEEKSIIDLIENIYSSQILVNLIRENILKCLGIVNALPAEVNRAPVNNDDRSAERKREILERLKSMRECFIQANADVIETVENGNSVPDIVEDDPFFSELCFKCHSEPEGWISAGRFCTTMSLLYAQCLNSASLYGPMHDPLISMRNHVCNDSKDMLLFYDISSYSIAYPEFTDSNVEVQGSGPLNYLLGGSSIGGCGHFIHKSCYAASLQQRTGVIMIRSPDGDSYECRMCNTMNTFFLPLVVPVFVKRKVICPTLDNVFDQLNDALKQLKALHITELSVFNHANIAFFVTINEMIKSVYVEEYNNFYNSMNMIVINVSYTFQLLEKESRRELISVFNKDHFEKYRFRCIKIYLSFILHFIEWDIKNYTECRIPAKNFAVGILEYCHRMTSERSLQDFLSLDIFRLFISLYVAIMFFKMLLQHNDSESFLDVFYSCFSYCYYLQTLQALAFSLTIPEDELKLIPVIRPDSNMDDVQSYKEAVEELTNNFNLNNLMERYSVFVTYRNTFLREVALLSHMGFTPVSFFTTLPYDINREYMMLKEYFGIDFDLTKIVTQAKKSGFHIFNDDSVNYDMTGAKFFFERVCQLKEYFFTFPEKFFDIIKIQLNPLKSPHDNKNLTRVAICIICGKELCLCTQCRFKPELQLHICCCSNQSGIVLDITECSYRFMYQGQPSKSKPLPYADKYGTPAELKSIMSGSKLNQALVEKMLYFWRNDMILTSVYVSLN